MGGRVSLFAEPNTHTSGKTRKRRRDSNLNLNENAKRDAVNALTMKMIEQSTLEYANLLFEKEEKGTLSKEKQEKLEELEEVLESLKKQKPGYNNIREYYNSARANNRARTKKAKKNNDA
jgi:hypothetical protein